MNSMLIPQSYLNTLNVLNKSGRESIIYLSEDGENVYKIYSDSGFVKPTPEKIYKLYERQESITHTSLPHGLLFTYNEQGEKVFLGIVMKYFKDHLSIDTITTVENVDMNSIYLNFVRSLKELTDNFIYPTDLNNKNILVEPATLEVQIIDLDGEQCTISDQEEKELMDKIFNKLLFHVYSPIIERNPELDIEIRKYGYDILSTYGYSDTLIKMLKKEEDISYEKIVDVINELYPKQEIKQL